MSKYTYCVITKVPKPWLGEDGNLYSASFAWPPDSPESDLYIQNTCYGGDDEDNPDKHKARAVTYDEMNQIAADRDFSFMLENFTLGEICILDEPFGREVTGRQRAPRKWVIAFEEFDNIDDAVARAKEVIDAEEDRELEQLKARTAKKAAS